MTDPSLFHSTHLLKKEIFLQKEDLPYGLTPQTD